MINQVILILALASASGLAGVISQPPLVRLAEAEPFDLNPRYDYSYSIHDAITGDAKTQRESRDGENVHGEYSIVEPDGTLRTVTYTAGREGFNAVVNRQVGYAAAAPVIVRKQPLVYAPQPLLAPAASIAHPAIARPFAVRKRVVYKTRPAQFTFPAFQNQLVGSYPQHIVAAPNPINFVQHQPIVPVQQQFLLPTPVQQQIQIQPQPEVVHEQPQPGPAPAPVQPQPIPAQPQPMPPQQIPAFPQPQPAPAQPQPPPQQIPSFPQPPPAPAQPQPQPQPAQRPQNDDFDTVEVEAAPRSAARPNRRPASSAGPANDGSSFTYTSRGNQYDFSVAY